jgi:hypothetical protein
MHHRYSWERFRDEEYRTGSQVVCSTSQWGCRRRGSARIGYRKLDQLFALTTKHQRPEDGVFVTFLRILFEFPAVLSWNMLWHDSFHEVRADLYGTAKALAPNMPFGFHIVQNTTFGPFYSAVDD